MSVAEGLWAPLLSWDTLEDGMHLAPARYALVIFSVAFETRAVLGAKPGSRPMHQSSGKLQDDVDFRKPRSSLRYQMMILV